MRKLLFATAAILVTASIATAQGYNNNGTNPNNGPGQNNSTIVSGPWMMRASTGDKMVDRTWYIMDRTLNAAEMDDLKTMFRDMPGNTAYTIQKAIIYAIDTNAKGNQNYGGWTSTDMYSDNGVSDYQIFRSMEAGLDWKERAVLDKWLSTATSGQMMAVAKLVRTGGWANAMWYSNGMGS